MNVLNFNPANNNAEPMSYTERTIHKDHGSMYLIRTASGHSIKVTDDHSLATMSNVGKTCLFAPLPPQEALGKAIPILMYSHKHPVFMETYSQNDIEILQFLDPTKLSDALLNLSQSALRAALLFDIIPCLGYKQRLGYLSDYEIALWCYLLGMAGIPYQMTSDALIISPAAKRMIPTANGMRSEEKVSTHSPYRRIPFTWSEVVEVTEVAREETTYDFTVPEFPLFIANAILVYDTMQVHVPVTQQAVADAVNKMRPSQNIFSVRTGDPMLAPSQEAIMGVYLASQPSKEKIIDIKDVGEASKLLAEHIVKPNHPAKYKGFRTTVGLILLNDKIPDKLRDYTSVWNKKKVNSLLNKAGTESKGQFAAICDAIKEYGFEFSYSMATTFHDGDFDLARVKAERDKALAPIYHEIDKIQASSMSDKAKKTAIAKHLVAAQHINQKLTSEAAESTFHTWAYSGAKGSPSQVMQIITSPTVVADAKDQVIPVPIKHSFLEGLTPGEYWASSYGTRKGIIGAKLSIAPAGMMEKELVGNVLDLVCTEHDCGSKDHIDLPIGDRKDILFRVEAGSNKLIDGELYEDKVRRGAKSVSVRSPMKCHAGEGVCQLCYGYTDKHRFPEIGEHLGVLAAHALAEPMAQMSLSAKHTAGTASDAATGVAIGLPVIQRFFTMPNQYAGAALIAQATGKVDKITEAPAGGLDLYIDGKRHHALPGRKLLVGKGDTVHAGDILTEGVPNMAHIVPHKGIEASRDIFVHHAQDLFNRAGAPALRKNYEVVARGLINYAEITSPGDSGFTVGEVVDYNKLKASMAKMREENPDAEMPKYRAVQQGTTFAPTNKADWLANLGYKYLKRNLVENAATGAESHLHGYHPIAPYATGRTFGKGEKGKY